MHHRDTMSTEKTKNWLADIRSLIGEFPQPMPVPVFLCTTTLQNPRAPRGFFLERGCVRGAPAAAGWPQRTPLIPTSAGEVSGLLRLVLGGHSRAPWVAAPPLCVHRVSVVHSAFSTACTRLSRNHAGRRSENSVGGRVGRSADLPIGTANAGGSDCVELESGATGARPSGRRNVHPQQAFQTTRTRLTLNPLVSRKNPTGIRQPLTIRTFLRPEGRAPVALTT